MLRKRFAKSDVWKNAFNPSPMGFLSPSNSATHWQNHGDSGGEKSFVKLVTFPCFHTQMPCIGGYPTLSQISTMNQHCLINIVQSACFVFTTNLYNHLQSSRCFFNRNLPGWRDFPVPSSFRLFAFSRHAQALTGKLCGADFPPAAPHGAVALCCSLHIWDTMGIWPWKNNHKTITILYPLEIDWHHEGTERNRFSIAIFVRWMRKKNAGMKDMGNNGVAANEFVQSHTPRNVFLIMCGVIHLWS